MCTRVELDAVQIHVKRMKKCNYSIPKWQNLGFLGKSWVIRLAWITLIHFRLALLIQTPPFVVDVCSSMFYQIYFPKQSMS